MVSARIQEDAWNSQGQSAKPSRRSSRSSYLSAIGGYESDIDERASLIASKSKWATNGGRTSNTPPVELGAKSQSPPHGPRDWRTRARSTLSPSLPIPRSNVKNTSGEWFAALNVEDDLGSERSLPFKGGPVVSHRPSDEHRSDTEPLDDEFMKVIPPYVDSQQDLEAAMRRLTTGRAGLDIQFAKSGPEPPPCRDSPINQTMDPEVVNPPEQRMPSPGGSGFMDISSRYGDNESGGTFGGQPPMDSEGDDDDDIYRREDTEPSKSPLRSLHSEHILRKLNDVHRAVSAVNEAMETMREENRSLKSRLESLETPLEGQVRARRSNQKKPYIVPRRRSEETKSRAKNVRKELDLLLDAHHEHPFASEQDVKTFEEEIKKNPVLRCCRTTQFQIDIKGGARSAWNKSAQLAFTEHYLAKHCLPDEAAEEIAAAFYARVKSIKATRTETQAQRLAKGVYVRKYGLFLRRAETLAFSLFLRGYLPLLQALSVEGMSSDEEVSSPQIIGGPVIGNNTQYIVKSPRWRSKELTAFLHLIDSIGLMQRRSDSTKQRGNWARVRTHDPKSPRLSNKTTFPKNLPRNAYDDAWLNDFPNLRLSVDPAPPLNLSLSPEILQGLLGPRSRDGE